MTEKILMPYVETKNQIMVYSQDDHEEFTGLYALMEHANKKIIAGIRENKKLKEHICEMCMDTQQPCNECEYDH